MPFTHYVKYSDTPLAWASCHCKATKSHYPGEEKGDIPREFYSTLKGRIDDTSRHARMGESRISDSQLVGEGLEDARTTDHRFVLPL